MRPAAAEWDEREETPVADHRGGREDRPLRLRGARRSSGPTRPGLTLPIVNEELFWGDAGIGLAIMGTSLGGRRHLRPGHARADRASGSRSASARPTSRRSARSACPSPTPAPTSRRCARARATTRPRTSGCSTARRRGPPTAASPTSTSSSPRSTRELGSRGQAAFVVPPGTPGSTMGTKFKKHGIRASHTAEVFLDDCRVPGACLLGGKEKLDERLARAREGTPRAVAGGDGDVRGHAARRSARRRSASPAPPTSTRSSTPRSASSSAGRSSRTRRSRSSSPT